MFSIVRFVAVPHGAKHEFDRATAPRVLKHRYVLSLRHRYVITHRHLRKVYGSVYRNFLFFMKRCHNLVEVIVEAMRIVEKEREDDGSEIFFRGVVKNHASDDPVEPVDTYFPCSLYQQKGSTLYKHERQIFEEAMRYNVASFEKDRTMIDRLVRMQHYILPTRIADLSENMIQGIAFAAGGGSAPYGGNIYPDRDGFLRIVKVAKHKMKSWTSDIITAIAHLPLVDYDRLDFDKHDGLDVLRYEIMKERPGFGFTDDRPRWNGRLKRELQQVWAFKPRLNNDRIKNQSGLFLAYGCGNHKTQIYPTYSPDDYENEESPSFGIKQVGAVQIAGSAKADILEDLRMFGMPEEYIYPELSNVCKAIGDRFKKKG